MVGRGGGKREDRTRIELGQAIQAFDKVDGSRVVAVAEDREVITSSQKQTKIKRTTRTQIAC
jgi:acetyl-CoA carboxylase carboxyltransferase component